MAIYCIDDGGDGSQTNTTHSASTLDWSKADATIADLLAYDSAAFSTTGNVVYFGHDHVDGQTHSGNLTITGPSTGTPGPAPVAVISADRTNSTPTYTASSSNQIDTSAGAYQIIWDGSFSLYGLCMKAGARISLSSDQNEVFFASGCKFKLAAGTDCYIGSTGTLARLKSCNFDVSADTANSATSVITGSGTATVELIGPTFTIGATAYRTGAVINENNSPFFVSGADFSGFTNANCEVSGGGSYGCYTNCITTANALAVRGLSNAVLMMTNCGTAESAAHIYYLTYVGDCTSNTSIYRGSGATVREIPFSWKIVTTATCSEYAPFESPWMYGTTTSGTKTFAVAVGHNNAGTGTGSLLSNADCWLEVEVMATADSPLYTLTSTHRLITASASDLADDEISEWTAPDTEVDDLQTLSAATVTVGEAGLYRVRVCVGKASTTVYADPKVTVT
jgi:hypothetical protein